MTTHPTNSLESYALGVLAPDDAAYVATHVQQCPTCQARLRDIDHTLGLLADLAPEASPPPEVEARLFAQIARLRQEDGSSAPKVNALSGPTIRRHRVYEVPALRRLSLAPSTMRVIYGLVAIAALLLLTVGILAGQLHTASMTNAALSARLAQQQQALRVLSVPGAVIRHLTSTDRAAGSATGTMVMDPHSKAGVFVVSNLPQLAPGKAYQFWLVESRPGSPEGIAFPTGTFGVDSAGDAVFTFTSDLAVDQLSNAGVSIEPDGGATHPDSPMIMLVAS